MTIKHLMIDQSMTDQCLRLNFIISIIIIQNLTKFTYKALSVVYDIITEKEKN